MHNDILIIHLLRLLVVQLEQQEQLSLLEMEIQQQDLTLFVYNIMVIHMVQVTIIHLELTMPSFLSGLMEIQMMKIDEDIS